jgi:hypothetical protein
MADDTRLRELYTASTRAGLPDHPGDEAWEALALGELATPEREQLFDHVTACAACADIYRGLKTLESEARAFDPGVPRSAAAPASRGRGAWYAGLAAAAVLVLAIALPFRTTPDPPPDVVRGPVVSTPIALAPVGDLSSAPTDFRWTPLTGAARHRVELSGADGDLLWTSRDLEGTHTTWPAELRLDPGTYFWRVVTVPDPDRRLSAPVASPLVSFRIP